MTQSNKSFAGYATECTGESGSSSQGATEKCRKTVAFANNDLKFYNDGADEPTGATGAFADMLAAIAAAERFIFIADWSFHPMFNPVRPGDPSFTDSIGAILIRKAKAFPNIVIAIHTWEHTYPQVDRQNDRGRKVFAALAVALGVAKKPRNLYWRATSRTGIRWTHHQKFLVCDCPPTATGTKRGMRAMYGGLDITKGRLDWPAHPHSVSDVGPALQRSWTAGEYTVDEWYNPEFGDDQELPRQPWHDVHAMLTGPAAWGFVREFVGRWNLDPAGNFFNSKGDRDVSPTNKIWACYQELRAATDILQIGEPCDFGPWTIEVCRSITQRHWGRPHVINNSSSRGMVTSTADRDFEWYLDGRFDRSIQDAYIAAINAAENFIYIENQYLIGSGALWSEDRKGVENSVPQELVNRILARAHTDFHVYIVLPMFPESDPSSAGPMIVRNYQWQTINYMIGAVQAGLKDPSVSWKKYLSFYFLANWKQRSQTERVPSHHAVKQEIVAEQGKYAAAKIVLKQERRILRSVTQAYRPESTSSARTAEMLEASEAEMKAVRAKMEASEAEMKAAEAKMKAAEAKIRLLKGYNRRERVRRHDRYMVYVHSKFMIVDDRSVLLGSANLNERSLAGDRDSEIACLTYADERQSNAKNKCHDVIQGLRKRLWSEHFGALPKAWDKPQLAECVRDACTKADDNYVAFRTMSRQATSGHICRWPFNFENGSITLGSKIANTSTTSTTFTEGEHLLPDAEKDERKWQWNSPGQFFLLMMDLAE